ncbi:preprotein translocase subunit SecE [Eubacteriales bacterium OttesenSCG-928-K08]|nr:preprotein translocase subunit SecE [Eubacteriales bacterium OttesenSCG-928-K08]
MAKDEVKTDKKPEKKKKASRFHPIKYIREVIAELKKVTWPTRQELVSHTGAVFAFVIGMAIIIGLLDFVFQQGMILIASIGGA